MAVWALNVNIAEPLVVTAGSALSKSPRGKSRELWATSGSHFPDVLKPPKPTTDTEILRQTAQWREYTEVQNLTHEDHFKRTSVNFVIRNTCAQSALKFHDIRVLKPDSIILEMHHIYNNMVLTLDSTILEIHHIYKKTGSLN